MGYIKQWRVQHIGFCREFPNINTWQAEVGFTATISAVNRSQLFSRPKTQEACMSAHRHHTNQEQVCGRQQSFRWVSGKENWNQDILVSLQLPLSPEPLEGKVGKGTSLPVVHESSDICCLVSQREVDRVELITVTRKSLPCCC